jgi:aspartyl-tRNA(Asn)/glutamyl-tRNA(Gln) amidotransferase subunit C
MRAQNDTVIVSMRSAVLVAIAGHISRIGFEVMRLSREEVQYVAELARLGLSDAEITRLQDQLSSILQHIAAIDRLDTDAIPPTAQVITMTNVMRADVVVDSLPREAVLENAPRQSAGFFEVHAILSGSTEDAS